MEDGAEAVGEQLSEFIRGAALEKSQRVTKKPKK